jgi:hypothetical protein
MDGHIPNPIELIFLSLDHPRRARIVCDNPKIFVEHETMAGALAIAETEIAKVLGTRFEVHIFAGSA